MQTGVTVPAAFVAAAICLTILVGGITFTGSMVAWAKLAEKISGRPLVFAGQKTINLFLLAASLAAVVAVAAVPLAPWSAAVCHRPARRFAADRHPDDPPHRRR